MQSFPAGSAGECGGAGLRLSAGGGESGGEELPVGTGGNAGRFGVK